MILLTNDAKEIVKHRLELRRLRDIEAEHIELKATITEKITK
jgi:hypothetical protein